MRSVERVTWRSLRALPMPLAAGLALAALAAVSGCDTIGLRLRSSAGADAAATPAAAASQAASAPGASGSGVARAVPTGPVAPATQRAYDDALAAMRAGRPADAERGFRALARSDADLAGPHANLGMLARQAGRLPEAVAELERATELDPQQPVAWNQLGITYRQNGDFAKARAAYDHALAIDPNYANAVLDLGVLDDLYLGDSAKALAQYSRYLALTPAGDPMVAKWVVDLKNRLKAAAPGTPASAPASPDAAPAPAPAAAKKEKT